MTTQRTPIQRAFAVTENSMREAIKDRDLDRLVQLSEHYREERDYAVLAAGTVMELARALKHVLDARAPMASMVRVSWSHELEDDEEGTGGVVTADVRFHVYDQVQERWGSAIPFPSGQDFHWARTEESFLSMGKDETLYMTREESNDIWRWAFRMLDEHFGHYGSEVLKLAFGDEEHQAPAPEPEVRPAPSAVLGVPVALAQDTARRDDTVIRNVAVAHDDVIDAHAAMYERAAGIGPEGVPHLSNRQLIQAAAAAATTEDSQWRQEILEQILRSAPPRHWIVSAAQPPATYIVDAPAQTSE